MREISIAAGCKRRIIRRRFSSLATTYQFNAASTAPDRPLAGTVEIKGSTWIFPKPAQRVPLQASHTVTAGVWDTFFSVDVIPEVDAVISLPSRSWPGVGWVLGLVAAIAIVAIALLLVAS